MTLKNRALAALRRLHGEERGTLKNMRVKKAGVPVHEADAVNFIDGANSTITVAYDDANDEIDVTIASTGGGGGGSGHTIQEDGVALSARTNLNFTTGIDVADDSVNDQTDVSVDTAELSVGGELSGTVSSATVAATHSGSAHHAQAHSGSDHTDPAVPVSQTFGDVAGAGTGTLPPANEDHRHGMPANPVTAHEAASDPHTGYVQETLPDAKGDLFTATAADTPARLAVGTNYQHLIADSAASTGLKWRAHEFFNVKDYGAIGDGTTNDTTAIQAAIDAAATPQGIVVFPSGTYSVTSAIDWKKGVKLLGLGNRGDGTLSKAALKYTGSAIATGVIRYTAADEVHDTWAQGMVFNANVLADYCVEIDSTGTVDHGFFFDNCAFQGAAKSSLYIGDFVTNLYFRNCRWDGWFDYAIEFASTPSSFSFQDGTMDVGPGNVAKGFVHFNQSTAPDRVRATLRNIRLESGSATVPNITEGIIRVTEPNIDTGNRIQVELEIDGIFGAFPGAQFNQFPVIKTRRADGSAGNKEYIRVTALRCEFNQRVLINDGVSDVDLGNNLRWPFLVFSAFDGAPATSRGPIYHAGVDWWRNQTFSINPPSGHVSLYAEGEVFKTKNSAGAIRQLAPGTPVSVGTANAQGSGTTFAFNDHVHNHGTHTTDLHTNYRQEADDHTHQTTGAQAGQLDHGLALTGLLDDDHTQYRLESADHTHQTTGVQAGTLDHGLALTGLTDDDHTQYRLESQDIQSITFSKTGTLATGTGSMRWYNDTGRTLTLQSARGSVGTAPSGASVIVDVNNNGVSVWNTTQANRITIAAGTNTDEGGAFDDNTILDGEYITVDIDQVGSITTEGSNLTVSIWFTS